MGDGSDDAATIRLDFSVSDPLVLTSVYISCLVVVTFIMMGLFIHRDAKDDRLKSFGMKNNDIRIHKNKKNRHRAGMSHSRCNPFFIHLCGSLVLGFCGLISIYVANPIFYAFNAFALFFLVIFFNHFGCQKYKYERCVVFCCQSKSKYSSHLLYKIFFDNKFKVNLCLSALLVIIGLVWCIIYSANIYTVQDGKSAVNTNNSDENYVFFLIIMTSLTLLHLLISSIYSKISLGVFVVLLPLFIIVILGVSIYDMDKFIPYEHLLVYWFVFLFTLVSSISFFSCSQYLKLRLISISLIGGFLSIFDLLTDLILIITWVRDGQILWVTLQLLFICSGTIFSSYFIKRFYFENDAKNKYIAQSLTLIGLGRLWHGIQAWDMDNHSYVMLLSNKTIKIWEMFLEAFPSITLQLWIVLSEYNLAAESSNAVIWSMIVSVSSITFTVFRILFFDHRARRKNKAELEKELDAQNDEIIRKQIEIAMQAADSKKIVELQALQVVDTDENKSSPSLMIANGIKYGNNSNIGADPPDMHLMGSYSHSGHDFNFMSSPQKAMSKFQRQMKREKDLRDQLQELQQRKRDALARREKERQARLRLSELVITFERKPLGCTLYGGENELNAWIADIREDNMHVCDGLCIGLYVHSIEDLVVDNESYLQILQIVRGTPAPITVGFNSYPPLNRNEDSVQQLERMGYSDMSLRCAWQELNHVTATITTKHLDFVSKMLQILSQFDNINDEDLVLEYPDLPLFENDDSESDSWDETDNIFGGYYYTQKELEHSVDEKVEQKYDSQVNIYVNDDEGDEAYLNNDEEKLGSTQAILNACGTRTRVMGVSGKKINAYRPYTAGNIDKNLAEIIGAVEAPAEDGDLLAIKFKRKPLGFDREAGRFGLNCKVLEIHSKKLREQGLYVGFYIRKINDRNVERLKFFAIESLLRNVACPMVVTFRISPPTLPAAMVKELEDIERKKMKRRKSRKSRANRFSVYEGDANDELLKKELKDVKDEEITIHYGIHDTKLLFAMQAADMEGINAQITSIKDVKLLDKGLRLKMFIHKINNEIVDNESYDTIKQKLILSPPFDLTFCIYKPIDFSHKTVVSFMCDADKNMDYTQEEIAYGWRILNRQKIDSNDFDFDSKEFEMEMLKILISQRQMQGKLYEKINSHRLIGLDFDPGQPITIFFEQRPLGFEIESGDELNINGKNAKISVITNNKYVEIGLKKGMLIHQINRMITDNLPFTNIASMLKKSKMPMTITFTKSIALSYIKYVIQCIFSRRPLGFEIYDATETSDDAHVCTAVIKEISDTLCIRSGVKAGMYIHNINGIDVMNNMKFEDLNEMLLRLQLPIDIGFINMDKVERDKQIKQEIQRRIKEEREKKKNNLKKKPMINDVIRQSQLLKMDREENMNERECYDCCKRGCLQDLFSGKTIDYIAFYIFTITDMYCRIFPMLVIIAYTKKRNENGSYIVHVPFVALVVGIIILIFETISYKKILYKEYNSWNTVFKQLYFSAFTISFFLLSTMGLAYLEKSVDFELLMKYEFTGRMIISLILVIIVTVHQILTFDHWNEWEFTFTIFAYYIMLIICVASQFYLKKIHKYL